MPHAPERQVSSVGAMTTLLLHAWFNANSSCENIKGLFCEHGQTPPVRAMPPNAFSHYDVAGNVWQHPARGRSRRIVPDGESGFFCSLPPFEVVGTSLVALLLAIDQNPVRVECDHWRKERQGSSGELEEFWRVW